jgi:uncharacterized membrane protein YedE/YeeE
MNLRLILTAFATGVIFALGLGISGMTEPQKVLGFLNLWNWDPSLLFVMAGAVGTHASLYPVIMKRKSPLFDIKWHVPANKDIDGNLIAGALIFGIGWGMGGYCPGPGITALASGDLRAVTFVVAMIAGIWCHRLRAGTRV